MWDNPSICKLSDVGCASKEYAPSDPGTDATRFAGMRHFIARGQSAFEVLFDHAATGAFCHGDAPTLADLSLIRQFYNARHWGADTDGLDQIKRIVAAAEALPAFGDAAPEAVRPTA